MAGDAPAIGIDLGNTNSCVAVWQNGRAEVIPNELGNRSTPSYVAFSGDELHVGERAMNQAALNPTNTLYDCKRLIGRRFSDPLVKEDQKMLPFEIVEGPDDRLMIGTKYKGEDKKIVPELVSSIVLSKMKDIAEAYLRTKVTSAVITVPACFNNSQRQATKDAGTIAGFDRVQIISEPTAAAIGYYVDRLSGISKATVLLIFDLGSGTFDVSLVIIEKGTIKVEDVSGDAHIGGNDFDKNMVDYLAMEFETKHQMRIPSRSRAMRKLGAACEKAKKILSTNAEARIEIDSLNADIDFEYTMSREKFEELNKSHFERCIEVVNNFLNDLRIDRKSIHEIIPVGGATRIPMLQKMLKEFFGKELCKTVNRDEVVACGAAIRAFSSFQASNSSRQSLMPLLPRGVSEVAPFSIIFRVSEYHPVVLFKKKTPISKAFKEYEISAHRGQDVSIGFWEREIGNNFLGCFTLPASRDAQLGVVLRFLIDCDGILGVLVRDHMTGQFSWELRVTEKGRLHSKEIENLTLELSKFKEENDKHKKRAIAKNALEDYLYKMSLFVKDDRVESVLPPMEKAFIEEQVIRGTTWMEADCDNSIKAGEFDENIKILENILMRTIEANKNSEDLLTVFKKIFRVYI